ncbi:hypothetical protein CEXT_685691 [Caerostris extrusa]|uniref:Uncharacterized protein n=1 Tax=Caerostris extrusa TaxID=172846 RepID=A0AAV4WUA2_CAEEX|nr:hypothetical protein CEXT_685691 [Caerostris extrusa]
MKWKVPDPFLAPEKGGTAARTFSPLNCQMQLVQMTCHQRRYYHYDALMALDKHLTVKVRTHHCEIGLVNGGCIVFLRKRYEQVGL